MTVEATRRQAERIEASHAAPSPRPTPEPLRPASGLILGLMLSSVLWLALLVLWLLF